MKIVNIYEWDYTYSKLDMGWRVQLSSDFLRKWRNVFSGGVVSWAMVSFAFDEGTILNDDGGCLPLEGFWLITTSCRHRIPKEPSGHPV